MKKVYNCPDVEVITVSAMNALCESQTGNFQQPTSTETIDPSLGL